MAECEQEVAGVIGGGNTCRISRLKRIDSVISSSAVAAGVSARVFPACCPKRLSLFSRSEAAAAARFLAASSIAACGDACNRIVS
eukprot:scaffold31658_cov28-Tisochrysis_lutea.AAC.2